MTLPIGDKAPNDLFDDPQVLGMLLGGTLFMAVGLLDDLTQLTPRISCWVSCLRAPCSSRPGPPSPSAAGGSGRLDGVVGAALQRRKLVDVHDGLAASLSGLSVLGFVSWADGRRFPARHSPPPLRALRSGSAQLPPARQYLGDTGAPGEQLGDARADGATMVRVGGCPT